MTEQERKSDTQEESVFMEEKNKPEKKEKKSKAREKKHIDKSRAEQKEKKPLDKKAKKKRRRIVMLVVLGVLIVLFFVMKLLGGTGAQAYVTTAPAVKGEIEQTISTSGTVTTQETKVYFSDVNVKIGEVKAEPGDAVKKGDLLIAYDEAAMAKEKELAQLKVQSAEGSYQNSLQNNSEAVGDLKEATVNLEVLEQQIADTENYIKGLEAKISQKQTDLAHEGTLLQISLLDWQDQPDSEEYLNLQKLVQLNSYEQQNNKEIKGWQDELAVYQDMLAEYQEYRSEMKSQKNSAEAGKMSAGAREELEASNQTNQIQAKDSLESLEAAESGITAAFDGVVTSMEAVEGSSVSAGTQLLTLESTEDVMVRITVTKYDLDKIALGQKAQVTIGSKVYEGEVSKINKMAEKNASGAAVVGTQIRILNPDSDVILGVEAKVVIGTAKESDAVLIPASAVNVDREGEFVYVAENNILVKKPIVTGISSDTMVQVLEGIAEGDRLVTDVTANLQEGMTVMEMPQIQAEQ